MTNLAMTRGDDRSLVVTLSSAGAPVDLTGAAIRFTAKYRHSDLDADAVISKATGAGVTITDAVAGVVTVEIAAADTDNLVGDTTLVWDVQVTLNGKVRTLAGGKLRVAPDVSRTAP
jgi:carbon monoxide dehydrogenase subunit G